MEVIDVNKNNWRRLFSIALAGTLTFSLAAFTSAAENAEKVTKITLLHTNDSHSRVFEGEYDGMGFAKLATLVKQQEEKNANTLLLDAGDTFHGQTFATLTKGESIAKVLNEVGYDGMAAGNHDFNYGYERLLELADIVNFPILSANVIYEETGKRVLTPYVVKEVDGIKLGFFGLSTPETHYKTHPKNVEGLKFTDPVEAAKEMVDELSKQGVDAIIAVTHLGTDASSTDTSIKVAEGAPGIDLIIDGHSHTMDNIGVSKTKIVSAGEYLKNLGVVELEFKGKELTSLNNNLITKEETATIEPDAKVQTVMEEVETTQKAILAEVVGNTTAALDGERDQVRKGETNLGNLITDAMLDATGADFSITNGGGIRASIDAGEITKGEVITVLPFGNYIQTKDITGKDVKAALENGASGYPANHGAFAHVAGLTYKIDDTKPVGERVHSIMIQGQPIDLNKTYSMATNDFMAAGGDNYTMFKDLAYTGDFPALDEAVIQYIKAKGAITPATEGRIVVEAMAVEAPQPVEAVKPAQPAPVVTEQKQPTTNVYVVQAGDTLSKIAREYGTTWQALHKLNKLKNPNLIYPAQKLVVPEK
ncbi:LysM peptidoglycan-binding domain-containing protein [Ammoniphilus sp. CFH 90114]|nr:LysM peptidoglycan-binding domain-containing protein [Ammoniphilus sp. CFH 90114]